MFLTASHARHKKKAGRSGALPPHRFANPMYVCITGSGTHGTQELCMKVVAGKYTYAFICRRIYMYIYIYIYIFA